MKVKRHSTKKVKSYKGCVGGYIPTILRAFYRLSDPLTATMSSLAEDSSLPRESKQDTATEEKSTIKIIEPQNFSRPLSRPNSQIASSITSGRSPQNLTSSNQAKSSQVD